MTAIFICYVKHSSLLLCPNCGSEDIMKNGTTRRGKQNYKCRDCGRQFVEKPQWKRREKDCTVMIDRLLLEKLPLAGIARVLKLSESWLRVCQPMLQGGAAPSAGDTETQRSLKGADGRIVVVCR